MKNRNIIGYHATLKESAIEITKTQTFKFDISNANKKFLGAGIYFYDERVNAIDWTIRMYKNKYKRLPDNSEEIIDNYRIITSELIVDENRILNLDEREQINKMSLIANMIGDKLKPYFHNRNDKPIAVLLNYLKKKNFLDDIDVVEKTYKFPVESNKYLKGINYINKKVICVKNNNIIKNSNISKKITQKEYNNSISIFAEGGD